MSEKQVEIRDMAYKSHKPVRDTIWDIYQKGRKAGIDEFKSVLEGWFMSEGNSLTLIDVYRFAEQLKE